LDRIAGSVTGGKEIMGTTDYPILLAEDEENDAMLLKMAFEKAGVHNQVEWVKDGMEAITYLNGGDPYGDRRRYPAPGILIIDVKMPRMGGLELLAWMRENPQFRIIPTIIMTSSRQDSDIQKAYELGANTYMIKPSSFDELVTMVKAIHGYWNLAAKPAPGGTAR
jgi:CheY-like chemotaxis protein